MPNANFPLPPTCPAWIRHDFEEPLSAEERAQFDGDDESVVALLRPPRNERTRARLLAHLASSRSIGQLTALVTRQRKPLSKDPLLIWELAENCAWLGRGDAAVTLTHLAPNTVPRDLAISGVIEALVHSRSHESLAELLAGIELNPDVTEALAVAAVGAGNLDAIKAALPLYPQTHRYPGVSAIDHPLISHVAAEAVMTSGGYSISAWAEIPNLGYAITPALLVLATRRAAQWRAPDAVHLGKLVRVSQLSRAQCEELVSLAMAYQMPSLAELATRHTPSPVQYDPSPLAGGARPSSTMVLH